MTHAILSPSSLKEALLCPGRVAMCANDDSTNDAAELGTFAHAILECAVAEGIQVEEAKDKLIRDGAPEATHSHGKAITVGQDTLDAVDVALTYITQLKVDGFAVSVEEQVSLEKVIGTKDMDGTSDVVALTDDSLLIADYKNGVNATDAKQQMMAYLLGAIAKYGPRDNYKCVVIQPRCFQVDAVREFEPTKEELREYVLSLRELYAVHVKGDAPRTPGDSQCQYCIGAKDLSCMEYHKWVAGQAGFPTLPPETVTGITDEELGELVSFGKRYTKWMKEVNTLAYNRAMAGDTIPGHKLVEGKRSRQALISEDKIEELLRKKRVKVGDFTTDKCKTIPQIVAVLTKKYPKVVDTFNEVWEFAQGKPRLVEAGSKGKEYIPEQSFE